MSRSKAPRSRLFSKVSTPAIVIGSLLLSLGLTGLGDTHAQAQRTDPRKHSRLVPAYEAGELRILDWALWNISKYYVEPDRINPHAMTLAGIEALENSIAEVLVEPLENGRRVRVHVGTAKREFQTGDVDALWAVGPHVREVFRFVTRSTELSAEQQRNAEYAIVAAVLGTLDPHTNLLRPEDFADMKTSTKGSFGGLGIEVGMRDGGITVLRVIDGNPAAKVGLLAGDRIVQIDAESTVTMNINEAVGLLRGAPGTTVTVYVMRDGVEKPTPFKITRATIQLDSVVGDVITRTEADGTVRKVGLAQIPRNFAQTTGRELRAKLEEFENAGVEGIILDLRDNPGGLLSAAVEVADAFLSSGSIVSTVGVSSPREENYADDRYDFPDKPLVVLIDQGSASASEIVAGALRNRDRAVLVGRRTFGKGSVQVLHERKVDDNELALKLTIAQYLTPGDVSIQSVGVTPDVETIPVIVTKEHIDYFSRERFDLLREESLADHLVSDQARSNAAAFGPLHFLERGSLGLEEKSKKAKPPAPEKRMTMLLEDPEIRIARDLVLAAPSSNRAEMLAVLDSFVSTQSAHEQKRIADSLSQRSIDWTQGPAPETAKAAKLRVSVQMNKPGNVIRGGESGLVTVKVTNEGDAAAFQVRGITDSDYRYFDERELLFGRIDPGDSRTHSIKLAVAEHELTRTDRIDLHLFEQHGAKLAAGSQTSIDVSAEGLPRPQFAYGYQVIDEPAAGEHIKGNGDGSLSVGERVKLRVHVKNMGEGPALDTWVILRNLSDESVFIHEGRAELKQMNPGDQRIVDLDLELKRAPDDEVARLQLAVSDNKIAEALVEKLYFPVIDKPTAISSIRRAVTTPDAVELFASPRDRAPTIALTYPNEAYPVTGEAGSWARLELGDGTFGFAKSSQLQTSPKKVSKPGKYDPILAVTPPRVSLVGTTTQTDQTELHLSGIATDGQAVRDIFITVFNPARNLFGDREKVFYLANNSPDSGKLEFAADIPLTPGNNLIEVHAREDEDVVAIKRMWVLRTSGLAEARKKEAGFETKGQLRVDTFR